jgi:murein DD-endopeptidase MepM/ murein hydrolase activator NlpD
MLQLADAKASPEQPIRANRLIFRLSTLSSCCKARFALLCVISIGCAALTMGEEGHSAPGTKVSVKMTKRNDGGVIRFFVENLERVGVTATFEPGLVNMRSSTPFPCTVALPPGLVTEVFSLSPLGDEVRWNYTLTNFFSLGDFRAVHRDEHLYELPFDAGESFEVSQAFGGAFSHSGPEQYAIDWAMPEGSAVRAARGGRVVSVKSDSQRGGAHRVYENDANFVLIEHEDGTIANYAHFRYRGVTVQIGQQIRAGDLIGYSGNTGYSSGPHLHLSVFKPRDGKQRLSVPVRFNVGGRSTMLMQGVRYVKSGKLKAPLLAEETGSKGARF